MIIAGVLISSQNEKKLVGVKDSKLLTPSQREKLISKIEKYATEIHMVEIPAKEIDEMRKHMSLNELEAMKMAELVEMFRKKPDLIIIDLLDPEEKKFLRRIEKYTKLKCEAKAEHKADARYLCVSAASVVAKVERDKKIKEIEAVHNITIGTGYPHDPAVISFLKGCKEYPDFVRKSWITAQRISEKKKQRTLFDFE